MSALPCQGRLLWHPEPHPGLQGCWWSFSAFPPELPKVWPSGGNGSRSSPTSQSPSSAFGSLASRWRAFLDASWHAQALLGESAAVGSRRWGAEAPHLCLAARPRKTAHHTICHIKSVNSCLLPSAGSHRAPHICSFREWWTDPSLRGRPWIPPGLRGVRGGALLQGVHRQPPW